MYSAQFCAKPFSNTISFNYQNNPMMEVLLLLSLQMKKLKS